ncbi:MAG: acyl-CoA dehydrogenase family protein [Candidatus Binatia bacterium]
MDFDFHDDEQAVADLARRIIGDHATNERLKALAARGAAYDAELWQALATASLLGAAIPEAHGGAGLGFLALGLLAREVGRGVAPLPIYPTLVLGALPLAQFGSAAQRAHWLPEVARGARLLTAALVEPGSSDPLAPATAAAPDGEGVRLSGVKSAVPYAAQASQVLVPARTADGAIGLFWVAPDAAGVALSAQHLPDGQPCAQLTLDRVHVAAAARLGAPEAGASMLHWIVQRAIVARCLMQLGAVERALEMTAEYGRSRIQFDRPLGSFQAFHQRAADAYVHVEAMRLSAWEAAWRLARDLPADAHVAVAKFWAAEGGQSAAYACQHLHGGIGIDVDYPLHRHFLWAIQLEHELGSAKHHLDALGRRIAADGLPPE